MHARLDQRLVLGTAKTEQAAERVGDVVIQFLLGDEVAAGLAEQLADASGDNQDADAAATVGRLDHKLTVLLQ